MSRIGKAPITVPAGVTITINDGLATVKGPKGTTTAPIPVNFETAQDNGILTVVRPSETKQDRSMHGLTRALLNNAVVGASVGFTKIIELRGVGYRAEVAGTTLKLALGYSHPVDIPLPAGIAVTVANTTPTSENGLLAATITITSHDKQILGDFAADVKGRRPVEPYKGKGLRYQGERVVRKVGKQADKKKK
ncbi:MAG TPA: 50S ribosomal protein L6 [Abditibacterium sp.]